MKWVVLLVSVAVLCAQAAEVEAPERTGLYNGCSECAGFVNSLVKLGEQSRKVEDAVYIPLDKQTKEDAEMSGADAQASLAHEEKLCHKLESDLVQSCVLVSQIYGLENVGPIASVAPDLLCEQITACRSSNIGGHKIMSKDQVVSVLSDAMLEDAANDVLVQTGTETEAQGAGVSKGVMGMMASLFKMRMQSQMMMQAMSMRQQLMENEHKMMQKIMRAMARNRAIRSELQHLKKMAYRAQPGNCDCCDACLPAKAGGKGKKGKGKKGKGK